MFSLCNKKVFLIFIFLLSCHSSRPKDQSQWIEQYKLAKKNKDCGALQSLSQIKDFSLKDVARIYKYRYCPDQSDEDFQWDHFDPWLRRWALRSWYHRSSQNENVEGFISASRQLSQISSDYGDKVFYLIKAVETARKAKSPQTKELLREFYQLSPSRGPRPKDMLAVAHDYKKRKLFGRAIQSFRKVLNSKTASMEHKQECYLNLQKLYKLTKNKSGYMRAVKQYGLFLNRNRHKNPKINRVYFSSQIRLAKSYWNDHDTNQALQVLDRLEKESSAPLEQVYWLKGKILEEKEEYSTAVSAFNSAQKAVQDKNSEFYIKLVWNLIWNLRKMQMYQDALGLLMEFETADPDIAPQFMFWKAHIMEEMGLKSQADYYYKQLIDQAPFEFHGLMAHYKMNHPLSLDLKSEKPKGKPAYQMMGDLILAEEKDLALKFMKQKIDEYEKQEKKASQEEVFQLLSYAAEAGFYLPFFQFIGGMPPEEKSRFMRKYAHILFPKIYNKEVKKAENLFDTSQHIIYSIMRQESAFNRRALSTAQAVGLMQVLPRLARSIARKEGIAFRKFSDLYDPETNILIGTAYLNQLFEKYGGYFILNTAIYNAGQEPVKKWIQRLSTSNPVEFIQNIPYNETRKYVRLIIRNFIFYELLNDPDHTIMFPQWILNLPKSGDETAGFFRLLFLIKIFFS